MAALLLLRQSRFRVWQDGADSQIVDRNSHYRRRDAAHCNKGANLIYFVQEKKKVDENGELVDYGEEELAADEVIRFEV